MINVQKMKNGMNVHLHVNQHVVLPYLNSVPKYVSRNVSVKKVTFDRPTVCVSSANQGTLNVVQTKNYFMTRKRY